jgi:hypothetical protein
MEFALWKEKWFGGSIAWCMSPQTEPAKEKVEIQLQFSIHLDLYVGS